MLGFLSKEKDSSARVGKDDIYFVSIPNGMKKNDIQMLFSQRAKIFADKLNLNTVYLHCGKDTLIYDFKV